MENPNANSIVTVNTVNEALLESSFPLPLSELSPCLIGLLFLDASFFF